jgi:hypothetical protein
MAVASEIWPWPYGHGVETLDIARSAMWSQSCWVAGMKNWSSIRMTAGQNGSEVEAVRPVASLALDRRSLETSQGVPHYFSKQQNHDEVKRNGR